MKRIERGFWAPSVTSQFCICPIPFHFDTYRGCQYGCLFCFARDFTRFARRGKEGDQRRQAYITGNSPEGLAKWCEQVLHSKYDFNDAAKLVIKFGRYHHAVNWKKIRAKVISEKWKREA